MNDDRDLPGLLQGDTGTVAARTSNKAPEPMTAECLLSLVREINERYMRGDRICATDVYPSGGFL